MAETDNWLIHDHRRYEAALADSELAAEGGEWKAAIDLFEGFVDDLRLHMRIEDEVVFPLVEEETGDPEGELAELRDEHTDVVRLMRDLSHVIRTRDVDHLLDSLRPLHAAMRRHTRHEEEVLSRLVSPALLSRREELAARLGVSRDQAGI